MKYAWLGCLLLSGALNAGTQDSEFNVNTRYTVEAVTISGDGWSANFSADKQQNEHINDALGKEIAETTRELNEALSALEGRTIEKITVSAVGPGEYGVTVSTEDFEIALRLGKAGARVASIGA